MMIGNHCRQQMWALLLTPQDWRLELVMPLLALGSADERDEGVTHTALTAGC